ncbi:uncharacterized protein LOC123273580 [Cotesia glomerata]|uniref:uncharacterized protein LOC123273580 n=1 Tax=Cotesia glomerata TaxID=32391 RepID=UPI001D028D49|nr:uncharacterized protein LOC123273580 [Cotesia glomerata]
MTANDQCPKKSRRLFVWDRSSKVQFLVDTGADLCVFPRQRLRGSHAKSSYELSAANGTPIATYGFVTLSLNLGLRRDFTWRFVIADVSKPILGADFLAHYGLLPDLQNSQLIDSTTLLTFKGKVTECEEPSIKRSAGHQCFTIYCESSRRSHAQMVHPGPPVAQKPRRLAPDKLRAAQKEFNKMVQMGIARPGKGSWASPLHMVPKKGTTNGEPAAIIAH